MLFATTTQNSVQRLFTRNRSEGFGRWTDTTLNHNQVENTLWDTSRRPLARCLRTLWRVVEVMEQPLKSCCYWEKNVIENSNFWYWFSMIVGWIRIGTKKDGQSRRPFLRELSWVREKKNRTYLEQAKPDKLFCALDISNPISWLSTDDLYRALWRNAAKVII